MVDWLFSFIPLEYHGLVGWILIVIAFFVVAPTFIPENRTKQ